MKRSLALATFLTLAAAAIAPLPSMAQSQYSIVVSSAPPAPVYEAVPAARPGYVWSQGHWEWRGYRHAWVPGVWVADRPGYVYSAPTWYRGDRGWYMEPARWERGRRDWDRRDWDRRDWDRRDGGRRDWDRHDARRWDRDGDGVPNRYDRAPDNWRRY